MTDKQFKPEYGVALSSLRPMITAVEVEAMVVEYRGCPNNIHSYIIADQSGSIQLWLWGAVGEMLAPGQIIRISGGYTKLFKNHLSLHIKKEGGRVTRTGRFRLLFSLLPDHSQREWMKDPKRPDDIKAWIPAIESSVTADVPSYNTRSSTRNSPAIGMQPPQLHAAPPLIIPQIPMPPPPQMMMLPPINNLEQMFVTLSQHPAANEIEGLKRELMMHLQAHIQSGLHVPSPHLISLIARLTSYMESMTTPPAITTVEQPVERSPAKKRKETTVHDIDDATKSEKQPTPPPKEKSSKKKKKSRKKRLKTESELIKPPPVLDYGEESAE